MIKIDNIRNISKNEGYENILIVRSLQHPVKNAIQKSILSPSKQLFYDYLSWAKAGEWNDETFASKYVPRFINELKNNRQAKEELDELCRRSKNENIALYCFCPNESLCHRSIVAGILLGKGADISCSEEYRKYYDIFVGEA